MPDAIDDQIARLLATDRVAAEQLITDKYGPGVWPIIAKTLDGPSPTKGVKPWQARRSGCKPVKVRGIPMPEPTMTRQEYLDGLRDRPLGEDPVRRIVTSGVGRACVDCGIRIPPGTEHCVTANAKHLCGPCGAARPRTVTP